ncbi:SLAP domain-containing protein [Companilactobacillus sp.]|uniref:SLAP domain-containing protein n=1 Tax=Companilactobacillus sp. TaxID=2767905 RepID=UPI0025C4159C|nr:SLAP domain-containing protein [Companilactobacillus sp.]MCH4009213.1 SLAP domain-containing protein [Companilactobacillus sp.]MCH4050608.1 SLAP domain-containing protein [Companilactobacillus sp.]MCH4077155.1 SLAP domain-containing protein [Companilactobacillus sp.]MCH4125731.1 SLAP domain-containing protein [Companilactobacillus sp.]MCI1311440.1 SLAP domain-containing protein [Companilactobacillus sp.]
MKKKFLVGTLLSGFILGSFVLPTVSSAAEVLESESEKKKKSKHGHQGSLKMDSAIFKDLHFVGPKHLENVGQTRHDTIQFMGLRKTVTQLITTHVGQRVTIKDYEKYIPKGYEVDTSRTYSFVAQDKPWPETFMVYLKKSVQTELTAKINFEADFGKVPATEVSGKSGTTINLEKYVPAGYSLATGQDKEFVLSEKTKSLTVKIVAEKHYDSIQFFGTGGFYSVAKRVGEKITLADYQKFIPKGFVIDKSIQYEFVSGNRGQNFIVYLKTMAKISNTVNFVDEHGKLLGTKTVSGYDGEKVKLVDTDEYKITGSHTYTISEKQTVAEIKATPAKIEKEIKYVTDDGVEFEGFNAIFDVNGQLVIDQAKIPAGYEIEYGYEPILNDGKKVITVKLFKTHKNTVQFVTPHGEIVGTTEIAGRSNHEVIVTPPSGFEYLDSSYKIFNILSDNTTQKVIVTSLENLVVPDDSTSVEAPTENVDNSETTVSNENEADQPILEEVRPPEIISSSEGAGNSQTLPTEKEPEPVDTQTDNVDLGNVEQIEKPTPDTGSNNVETAPNVSGPEVQTPEPNPIEPGDFIEGTNPEIDENNPQLTEISGQIITHGMGDRTQLYDQNGQLIDEYLAPHSDWKVDQRAIINGEIHYRVSTNGWLKASESLRYDPVSQIVTTGDKVVTVYDSQGNATKRSLAANTSWKADKVATINGKTFYRVSINEWIAADELN